MIIDTKIRSDVEKKEKFCHSKHNDKAKGKCERCANHRGFNRKYDLNLCRRCTFNQGENIGFKSYN